MAKLKNRHPSNKQGLFFVDTSCIDCDVCRDLSSNVFTLHDGQSIVFNQPSDLKEIKKSLKAMVACPVNAIGTTQDLKSQYDFQNFFPELIEDNVYYLGYHAKNSFGAYSYYIQLKNGGVIIDSPRYSLDLIQKIEELGGAKYMLCSHKDDVADHKRYKEALDLKRVISKEDINSQTENFEILFSGDKEKEFLKDLLIIPVPGHTKGSLVFLYKEKFLFTGDHLAFSPRLNALHGFHRYCWYDWQEQIRSMEKLLDYNFQWILPGHGRKFYRDNQQMKIELKKCIELMKEKS